MKLKSLFVKAGLIAYWSVSWVMMGIVLGCIMIATKSKAAKAS